MDDHKDGKTQQVMQWNLMLYRALKTKSQTYEIDKIGIKNYPVDSLKTNGVNVIGGFEHMKLK